MKNFYLGLVITVFASAHTSFNNNNDEEKIVRLLNNRKSPGIKVMQRLMFKASWKKEHLQFLPEQYFINAMIYRSGYLLSSTVAAVGCFLRQLCCYATFGLLHYVRRLSEQVPIR